MTPDEIKELRKLCDEASGEEWRTGWLESYDAFSGEPVAFVYRLEPDDEEETAENRIRIKGSETKMDCDADARFIAAARTALPRALDRIEELEARLKEAVTSLGMEIYRVKKLERELTEYRDGFNAGWDAAVERCVELVAHPRDPNKSPLAWLLVLLRRQGKES